MYTTQRKGIVTQTVIAPPDNPELARFLTEATLRGHKLGSRVALLLSPLCIIPLFLVNAFLRPDRGAGAGAMAGAAFGALVLGGMIALAIGFVVMTLASRKLQKQVDAHVKNGEAIEVHPLLRELWEEELDRLGLKLEREQFARELSARYEFFKELRPLAAQAADPKTERPIKEQTLKTLAKAMRAQGHRLPKRVATPAN